MKNRIAILLSIVLVCTYAFSSPLMKGDIGTIAIALLLGAISIGPSLYWVFTGMQWLPLFELYALVHLGYYWVPSIGRDSIMWQFPDSLRFPIIAAVCTYLSAAAFVYY